MKGGNRSLSFNDVKRVEMVVLFHHFGFESERISYHQYWYFSPFHYERTPSFKSDRNKYGPSDFVEGKEDSFLDFGIQYDPCSVSELIQHRYLIAAIQFFSSRTTLQHKEKESSLPIADNKIITSPSFDCYLKENKVDVEVARLWWKEISFLQNDKYYFAFGFQNNSGGYDLRNFFFKGRSRHNDITILHPNSIILTCFGGFVNFLFFKTVVKKLPCVIDGYCILNSLFFLFKGIEPNSQYRPTRIFFDRYSASRKATVKLLRLCPNGRNESGFYKCY